MTTWPASLAPYVDPGSDRIRFRSAGAHPFVWVAVPLGLALIAGGIAGLVSLSNAGVVAASIVAVLLGGSWLVSSAYSAWGSLEIEHTALGVRLTTRLASWSRSVELPRSSVRTVELYSPPPYNILWPGSAGRQLEVHLQRRDRPIHVAAGLSLGADILESLRTQLAPP